MDDYLITESYFTFVVMLGALILLISWRHEQIALALVAGFLLAFSAQIRTVGYALVFTLAPVLLIRCRNPSKWTRALRAISAAFVLVGFLGVWGAHRVFVKLAVTVVTNRGCPDLANHAVVGPRRARMRVVEDLRTHHVGMAFLAL